MQTQIPKNWQKYRLNEFSTINPSVKLKKGDKYPFVAMENVEVNKRFLKNIQLKKFNGNGTKFQAGDTLFERITPCLENGKIAQFNLINGENGFGSTEYFVFRDKKNVSDSNFLYYLLQTYEIRKHAENSMAGASGRQRADLDYIKKIEFFVPNIIIQQKIATILSAFDELIENNRRRIEILEEEAQLLYREWFVEFRFPGHEKVKFVDSELGKIPEGWEIHKVEDLVKRYSPGKLYDSYSISEIGDVPVLDQGQTGIIGYHNDKPSLVASLDNPVIIFANHTCYQRVIHFPFSSIQNVLPFKSSKEYSRNLYWLHFASRGLVELNDYKGHWPELMSKKLLLPPTELCESFGEIVGSNLKLIYILEKQNEALVKVRDLLLPKLMSGKIEV